MPSILVTTDLSEPAALAYPVALQLARALRCELRFLHIVHRPLLTPAFTDSSEQERVEALAKLAALGANVSGVPVHGGVEIAEDVCAAIGAEAKRSEARFLVVAASGKSGWQKLRLGSVSRALVHAAPVPIVLVPTKAAPPVEQRTVVVTTDLTAEALRALPVAQELGAALRLPVTLLGAATDDQTARAYHEIVSRQAAGAAAELAPATAMSRESVPTAIATWAREHGAAFVCMAPRPRGNIERLLFGSVVDAVVAQIGVPAVVVPPQA